MTEEASKYNGLKVVYSINDVGKIGHIHAEKWKVDHLLIPHTRINSKWIKNLNVTFKIINIIEKKIHNKILDIACSNILSDMSPQAREVKEKNQQMGLHQIKKFLHSKGKYP